MKIKSNIIFYLTIVLLLFASHVNANEKWISLTLDNDLFVGNDSGYSNGLYISLFESGNQTGEKPKSGLLLNPLKWSLPNSVPSGSLNAYTLGQAMNTPQDITIENPSENDLPYSAMLFFNNSYLHITPTVADKIGTTIGVIGPIALGEQAQKFVHGIIGSDEPLGWDTQLDNELVFQFSRSRAWRTWSSPKDTVDILTHAEFNVGTILSGVQTGFFARYGKDLTSSYATTLLSSSRSTNPVAINNGWYVYAGATAGYVFNQIFADGNTFKDSRSVGYDRESIGITAGVAYSRGDFSLTFAVNDTNIIQSGDLEETLEDLTQFGTLTFSWRR